MFTKIVDVMSAVFTWVGVVLQALMVLVVCYTVLTRYFFDYTPSWGEVGALLCMVWFGFISIALGVRDNLHLSLDIIDRFLPAALVRPLEMFKYCVIMACAVFMIYQGVIMVEIGMQNQISGLSFSSAWMYAEVPLAGVAIVGYCLIALGRLARNEPESESAGRLA